MNKENVQELRELLRIEAFRDKFKWEKVRVPKIWTPLQPGEELLGYYGGRTIKNGTYGQYEVALVHALKGSYLVSGAELIQLLDASMVSKGHPVRVIFNGMEQLPNGHSKKRFELYVAQDESLQEDELPVTESSAP